MRGDAGRRAALVREVVLPAAVLLVPLLVVCLAFWPGHMSADTLTQVEQSRTGDLTNQHAPILIAIWGVAWDLVGAGPGWILVGQNVVFLLGCYLLLRGVMRPLAASLTTVAIAAFPAVFGMLGYVSRDVWFTALLLLTFALVLRAGQAEGRPRTYWAAGAVAVAWLTLASRQNAAPAVVIALVILVGVLLAIRRRPRLVALVAGTALTLVLMASQFAVNALLGVRDVNPEAQLYTYDLAAISIREGRNLFPPDVMRRRGMTPITSTWDVDTVGGMVFPEDAVVPVNPTPAQMESLKTAWREAIVDHPLDYLDARWDVWTREISIGRGSVFVYHPVIDANGFGFRVRNEGLNDAAKDYVEAFARRPILDGTLIHAIWLYLLICAAAAVVLIRRGSWANVTIAALAIGAITYQAGLFVGIMATQYRWQFSVVVTGLIAVAALAAGARRERRTA